MSVGYGFYESLKIHTWYDLQVEAYLSLSSKPARFQFSVVYVLVLLLGLDSKYISE